MLKETINKMVDRLQTFATEVTKVAREVGTEGKLGGQAKVEDVEGTWKALTENVNGMATNLTTQVRSIASVTTAVAEGNLSRKIDVHAQGEILQLKETINKMVERLQNFATEVTKVAREVGTDGILGGQAKVQDVEGTWKDLTDNVNSEYYNHSRTSPKLTVDSNGWQPHYPSPKYSRCHSSRRKWVAFSPVIS